MQLIEVEGLHEVPGKDGLQGMFVVAFDEEELRAEQSVIEYFANLGASPERRHPLSPVVTYRLVVPAEKCKWLSALALFGDMTPSQFEFLRALHEGRTITLTGLEAYELICFLNRQHGAAVLDVDVEGHPFMADDIEETVVSFDGRAIRIAYPHNPMRLAAAAAAITRALQGAFPDYSVEIEGPAKPDPNVTTIRLC